MVSSREELDGLAELFPDLLGPGERFELRLEDVLGVELPVWVDRASSMREVLRSSLEHGGHPYLVSDDVVLTYEDNARTAAAIGRALRERYAIRPGDRVAILAANSPAWVQAFWGSQWAGAVTVGLNSWWSAPEVAYAIDHCEPTVVVADERRRELLPDDGPRLLSIEDDVPALGAVTGADDLELEVPVDEDDPAVILYTSGTTGRPKGVVHTHRNLAAVINFHGLNDALAAKFAPAEGPPRRDLMILPLFHIASLHNLAVARLGQGTSLVVYEGRFEADRVLATLERHRVTNWGAVPTMARRLIRDADPSRYDLSALRRFALASAPSTPEFHAQLRERIEVVDALSNSYGLTETATAITVATPLDLADHPTSVGKPIVSVQVEIRDADGHRLPDGETGEVWARSQFNMLEYWRDPEATAATITQDRWLRTGDLGRFEAGQLFLDTRRSDLIIRGGENVYPAEVERRLIAHAAVEEVLVVGVDEEDLGQVVGAIVVLTDEGAVSVEELADFAARALAHFKVPVHWHLTTDPLPRNATGKVVRSELADVFGQDRPADAG